MSIQTTELSSEALLAAARVIPVDQPVFMVNLVRYKERADYGGEHPDLPPCSGREAYFQRYVPAFTQVVAVLRLEGIKPVWLGGVLATLVVPSAERWDHLVIVEYPTYATLRKLLESPEYRTQADPHRRAALADWRFIATAKLDLPS